MFIDSAGHTLIADPDEPLGTVFHHNWTSRNDPSFEPRFVPLPTDANPGTPEKIAILKARLETGAMLHHPEDRLGAQRILTRLRSTDENTDSREFTKENEC